MTTLDSSKYCDDGEKLVYVGKKIYGNPFDFLLSGDEGNKFCKDCAIEGIKIIRNEGIDLGKTNDEAFDILQNSDDIAEEIHAHFYTADLINDALDASKDGVFLTWEDSEGSTTARKFACKKTHY